MSDAKLQSLMSFLFGRPEGAAGEDVASATGGSIQRRIRQAVAATGDTGGDGRGDVAGNPNANPNGETELDSAILAAYLDGGLDDAQRREVDQALAQSPDLREQLIAVGLLAA